ncbi:hypothetical protein N7489_002946 [Penicillium chrysogenum]|uniref:Uncharacterized protein n=1 Tax=Penicillium chrysogenum TaxID=5076 RepID=A0ABQ8WN65_PENCH|nr:uncharacterized protein N7489_002946 [Penicillium chrysogenum]XP_061069112.1 uncharacterized protein N7525_009348 [Penicillium rubens]KAJ5252536.1 hypothetical protein N7489_002946 [Penicillium chrysogenum]KAJ5254313.1 hypothetical protein N7524_011493 [Penicillium chrysogenum]KAJ5271444.1 hypothetical protein N7505_007202 [Penicillium chrysogenum]KAJ5831095.1 hypothetical protein N7525_009348 [Penicillium rubens]KAJ6142359.1 hypothetical protein N7497_011458 [Penicillium chrysogenum]
MSSRYPQTELVSTTLREGISGYISRAKLENRLYEIFGRKIEVVYFCGLITFQAKREVKEHEIADLCEDVRVNWN